MKVAEVATSEQSNYSQSLNKNENLIKSSEQKAQRLRRYDASSMMMPLLRKKGSLIR